MHLNICSRHKKADNSALFFTNSVHQDHMAQFLYHLTLFFIIYFQVQETARSIIENLEGDSEQTLPMTSSPAGGRPSVDKAADKWSLAFCEFYRDN